MDTLLPEQSFQCHRFHQLSGAADLKAIVEHPDLDAQPFVTIVPVGDGVDDGLLPGEGRILQFFLEEKIDETLAFPQMRPDGLVGLLDEQHKRPLNPFPLDDVQCCAHTALCSFVLDEINAAARMPAPRVLAEKQKRGQREDRPAIASFRKTVMRQDLLR